MFSENIGLNCFLNFRKVGNKQLLGKTKYLLEKCSEALPFGGNSPDRYPCPRSVTLNLRLKSV